MLARKITYSEVSLCISYVYSSQPDVDTFIDYSQLGFLPYPGKIQPHKTKIVRYRTGAYIVTKYISTCELGGWVNLAHGFCNQNI